MNLHKLLVVSVLISLFFNCKEHVNTPAENNTTKHPLVYLTAPTAENSSLPYLFSNEQKTFLSWVTKKGDTATALHYAELVNNTWQNSQTILQGDDWFVNWADFPMIAENNGNLWSHVLKKSTKDTYSYDVKMNVKPKEAQEWQTDLPLHTDGTPTEHGFVSILPYKDGFFSCWLDGRNTEENEAGERGAMTVRAAEIDVNGGVTVEKELDARTCDCCQTTAAITANGPVVLYRDRSTEEVRDIYIVRNVAGEWTTPKALHNDGWKIKGCPVNGPKAAAIKNTLVVAWFTEAQQKPRVQLAFSQDGGANFKVPIVIEEGKVLGRVDVALIDEKNALVSWMGSSENKTQLKAMKVSLSGEKAPPLVIATIDASRKTGFPQMERIGDNVHFAWTAVTPTATTIKTAYVPFISF